MGNSNSTKLDFEYNIASAEYNVINGPIDSVFGEIYEVQHNTTGEKLFLKVKETNDLFLYQQMIENCFQRLSLSHPNLSKVYGFGGLECNNGFHRKYQIYIYFEALPKSLMTFLESRSKRNIFSERTNTSPNFLVEKELYNIIIQIIGVMEYLQTQQISHGDIRPETCFINDQENIVLCDRKCIYQDEQSSARSGNLESKMLSTPLTLEADLKQRSLVKQNNYKADVFSLGMTILECATLRRSLDLYQPTKFSVINEKLLKSRLSEVQMRYSAKISNILMEMLIFEEEIRPDFISLKHFSTKRVHRSNSDATRTSIGPKLAHYIPTALPGYSEAFQKFKADFVSEGDVLASSPQNGGALKRKEEEVVEFETEINSRKSSNSDSYVRSHNEIIEKLLGTAPSKANLPEECEDIIEMSKHLIKPAAQNVQLTQEDLRSPITFGKITEIYEKTLPSVPEINTLNSSNEDNDMTEGLKAGQIHSKQAFRIKPLALGEKSLKKAQTSPLKNEKRSLNSVGSALLNMDDYSKIANSPKHTRLLSTELGTSPYMYQGPKILIESPLEPPGIMASNSGSAQSQSQRHSANQEEYLASPVIHNKYRKATFIESARTSIGSNPFSIPFECRENFAKSNYIVKNRFSDKKSLPSEFASFSTEFPSRSFSQNKGQGSQEYFDKKMISAPNSLGNSLVSSGMYSPEKNENKEKVLRSSPFNPERFKIANFDDLPKIDEQNSAVLSTARRYCEKSGVQIKRNIDNDTIEEIFQNAMRRSMETHKMLSNSNN